MQNIAISKGVWKELRQLRDQEGLKHYNAIIQFLIEYYKGSGNAIHLSSETCSEIIRIGDKNGCKDVDETIKNMIILLRKYQNKNGNEASK